LYALLEDARLARSNMKVLAPSQWASPAGDGSIRPNLPVIRDWVDRRFYRVRPASGGD
jgi:hypothetical protein